MPQSVLDPAPEATKRLGEGFVESWWRILKRFLWITMIWCGFLNISGGFGWMLLILGGRGSAHL